MSLIVKQLQEMRSRVPMYIGSNSVVKLAAFLRGYEHAVKKFDIAPNERFLEAFRDWVTKRFGVSISKSWEDIVSFYTVDEKEAMSRFWKLFDEYVAENPSET